MRLERLAGLLAASSLLVVDCGTGQANPSGGAPSSPTATRNVGAAPTPSPSPQLDVSLAMVYTTIYGTSADVHCPHLPMQTHHVVLVQPRLTYTSDEIGRIASVATGQLIDYGHLDPALLADQLGAATGAPPAFLRAESLWTTSACAEALDVTNTGKFVVQIPRVGLRLTEAPAPNPYVYRLVEFCSVLRVAYYCGPEVGAGPPDCSVYGVEIPLTNQAPGTDFLGTPAQVNADSARCPQVTLAPDQTVTFLLGAFSTAAMLYRAVPVLEVITPNAEGTVAFPQLASNYVFADPSQFSCYKLSGQTFVLWEQGAAAYDLDANSLKNAWCP